MSAIRAEAFLLRCRARSSSASNKCRALTPKSVAPGWVWQFAKHLWSCMADRSQSRARPIKAAPSQSRSLAMGVIRHEKRVSTDYFYKTIADSIHSIDCSGTADLQDFARSG